MKAEISVIEPGFAKRPVSFSQTANQAEIFQGTTCSVLQIMGLIARMGSFVYQCDDGAERRLSHGAKNLLSLLVSYTDSRQWESGGVFVWTSNTTLADELGASVRQTQSRLFELEAAGLIARRYDCVNEREERAGIDLRPLGSRLDEIEETIQARYDARDKRRKRMKESTSTHERFNILEYKTKGYSENNRTTPSVEKPHPVDKTERGSSPRRSIQNGRFTAKRTPPDGVGLARERGGGRVPLERLASDSVLDLMVAASPTFKRLLAEAIYPGDYRSASITEIVRIVQAMRVTYLSEYNERQWVTAVERHGASAALAVLVAAETPGINNRAAYLAGILKKGVDDPTFNPIEGLRRIVRH